MKRIDRLGRDVTHLPGLWDEEDTILAPRAVEYQCDKIVAIRLCPKFESCIGDKPEYWYLKKPNCPSDATFGHLVKNGYETLYWTDRGWNYHTPTQFPTVDAAFAEYVEKIKAK